MPSRVPLVRRPQDGATEAQASLPESLQGIALAMVLVLFVLACSALVLITRFTTSTLLQRDFRMADLFIEADSFPEGWTALGDEPDEACSASPLGSGCPTYGEEVSFWFRDNQHRATETIYRFQSPEEAGRGFDEVIEAEFLTWPEQEPWRVPRDLQLEPPGAARAYGACRMDVIGRECQLAAQYEEFVAVLFVQAEPLDDAELAAVVEAIDERMTRVLP